MEWGKKRWKIKDGKAKISEWITGVTWYIFLFLPWGPKIVELLENPKVLKKLWF